MNFDTLEKYQIEVDKAPPSDAILVEDGRKWLKQSYAIERMNEVFGEGKWNIEGIKKEALPGPNGAIFGYTCSLTIAFIHPVHQVEITRIGVSGTPEQINNNIIGRAFLDAIASIGNTFGRGLTNH